MFMNRVPTRTTDGYTQSKRAWAPRLPLGVQSSLGRLLLFSARKVEEVALGAWRVGDGRSVKGRAAEEEYLDARMDRVAEENQGSISIQRCICNECIVMSALRTALESPWVFLVALFHEGVSDLERRGDDGR